MEYKTPQNEYSARPGEYGNDPAAGGSTSPPGGQPQPVFMQPLQPGQHIQMQPMGQQPMYMQPMGGPGGPPMVGAPVMAQGTPMGHPHSFGGGPIIMAPMHQAMLEWQRPQVCSECTAECCLAGCCPCISVSSTMTLAKMTGPWAFIVGILVFLQYVSDGIRNSRLEDDPWPAIRGLAGLFNLVFSISEAMTLVKWKEATGRHIRVRDPDGNCGEDFCLFWCCVCYTIPAVHRTVEDWHRMGGGSGGGQLSPNYHMPPTSFQHAGLVAGGPTPVVMGPPIQVQQQPQQQRPAYQEVS
ncbi:unnamed protein product [Amoebophrya sp. A120]|nr:unnamed protein product [Amoebophrya sp. A120]|eukprot:GSA120T00022304001.1